MTFRISNDKQHNEAISSWYDIEILYYWPFDDEEMLNEIRRESHSDRAYRAAIEAVNLTTVRPENGVTVVMIIAQLSTEAVI